VGSRLIVLGGCGAWPEAGRACSGFLLEHRGTRIVLDLGYGTLPRLLAALGSSVADGLDAVVVTHHHPDHMVDLHGLLRARWYGHRAAAALPLYAPKEVLARLSDMEDDGRTAIRHVFDWHPLPAGPYTLGPFRLDSAELPHFVPASGVRLSAPGLVIAYTGDTGPDPALARLAREADLFIAEASDRDQQAKTPPAPSGAKLHLSAEQAARAAVAAGARRLLLTHFWPGNNREHSRRAAAAHFPGDILLADEGLTIPLP
jgi:ribonuclease BN (tRNA processing enzyme)